MRKWIVLLIPLLLILTSAAQAQGSITFDSLNVSLLSEYDQPSMLVIYDFQVTADTALPASVALRIPSNANITAVAYSKDTGLLNADFSGPTLEGNWQVVTIFVNERTTYHLEYYQLLTRDTDKRSFDYQWTGDYPVNNLRVEAHLPLDSTSINSTPTLPFTPGSGSLIASASATKLAAGKGYSLRLSYNRTSDETMVKPSSGSQLTAEPVTPATAGRVTLDNLPYVLGIAGIVLIAGAIYYFWHTNSNQSDGKVRRRSSKQKESGAQVYCHECGTRASADDRFCRVCGTKLRNE